MKYIDIGKYNREFLGKVNRGRVYFNPDNTIAIFEEGDDLVLGYVVEKASALKAAGFFMNPENEAKIRAHVEKEQAEKVEVEKKEVEEKVKKDSPLFNDTEVKQLREILNSPKNEVRPDTVALESRPLFSEDEFAEITESLDSKPTLSKLTRIVKSIVEKLGKAD